MEDKMPESMNKSELEKERERLVDRINELVPNELQTRINEAIQITAPRKKYEAKVSYSGTADADPE